ncbi:hypothetical protein TrispH2_004204 [Trichoplax sp. H2]|nr:hypothetical protein TrispH2_004204 [Trichoplax sp. H2]|eukprot:RDD43966.1 hypothetical protein TrispH2_004204 [Trichoplax sp. H2]
MLCASCRSVVSELHNFCFNCGVLLRRKGNKSLSRVSILNADDEIESVEQSSSGIQAKRCKLQGEREVTINIGQAILDSNYEFKKIKGKTRQVKLLPSSSKDMILERALKDITSKDSDFDDSCEYALLYPDFNEITTKPGSEEEFVLKDYKQNTGKRWTRITFLVAKTSDIERWAEKSDSESECSDESSFEDAQCDVNSRPTQRNQSVREEQSSTEGTSSISVVDNSHTESGRNSTVRSSSRSNQSMNGKNPILESLGDEISTLGEPCNVGALLVGALDDQPVSDQYSQQY